MPMCLQEASVGAGRSTAQLAVPGHDVYASEALEYSETQEVPSPTQVAGIYTSVSAYASNSLRLFASYLVHYN